jgi:ATP-dependent Clp protease ATP-binding subunit ClpC
MKMKRNWQRFSAKSHLNRNPFKRDGLSKQRLQNVRVNPGHGAGLLAPSFWICLALIDVQVFRHSVAFSACPKNEVIEMAERLCEICKTRPATVKVRVSQGGEQEIMDLCDVDYRRLSAQSKRSPYESLFGSDVFNNLFGDDRFSDFERPRRASRRSEQDSVDLTEHFSEQLIEILQSAADNAEKSGKSELDTEDVLEELCDIEVVQMILKQFKLSAKDLQAHVRANTNGDGKARSKDARKEIGISPRVKSALQLAMAAAQELGHSYVGPEHLLIGLTEEADGLAGQILRKYGLTAQALRQQTVKVVGKGAEEGKVNEPSTTPQLDKFSRDLTASARKGKLDPVIGRTQEIETMIEVLARRKKNNPVIIGEPGVGKTAIVEGLAQRIANGDVPEVLRDKKLVELNINSMVAGSKYRGEFEERVKNVLEEVIQHSDELVLFIDELHTIMGAGQNEEGGLDIANVFKPALARGELHLIGATTLNEYQKHIEKDAALERRFQPIIIAEPTVEQTITILRGLRDSLEAHHKVIVSDEAIVAAAELSDRYIASRYLPDKAIDLIDQACARVRIGMTSRPSQVHDMEAQIKQLKREQDYAKSRKQFDKCKLLEAKTNEKEDELEKSLEEWKGRVGTGSVEVKVEHIAEIVSKLTGIPMTELTQQERERLIAMESRIHKRVIGQDEAIVAVSDAVRLARAGLKDGRRPIATFLFLGPTGVGKTELAKALAEIVFGDEDALVRIDMSEYAERHTVARLVGAPPGYVGFEEGGQLTERIRRKPHTVILFDEIEKAHPEVHNLLLQVFDDGRLTDGKGRLVDFTNTIIICTSNLGAEVIQENIHMRKSYAELKSDVMGMLKNYFRPELINRIDDIIVFHSLNKEQIKEIVKLQLERVRRTAHGQGLDLNFDESIIDYLSEVGFMPEYGARELKRKIRTEVETRLAGLLLRGDIKEGDSATISYDEKKGATIEKTKEPSLAKRK